MRLKLNYTTLEGLYLNKFSKLQKGVFAYLEDSSWWEYLDNGLQKKDILFTLDSNRSILYKASIYRKELSNKWYMHSILENKVVECQIVSTDYKDSENEMVVNDDNMFVLTSTR